MVSTLPLVTAAGPVVDPIDDAVGTVTSTYGARWGGFHDGRDIAAPLGTPIRSVHEGTVIAAGPASGYGLWVRVAHDDGTVATYGHVHHILVEVGEQVEAGDTIATVGNRGNSTGPHLHFEISHDAGISADVDPSGYLAGAEPSTDTPQPQPEGDTTQATDSASPDDSTAVETYTVQRGDTLWGIAKRELGDPARWRDIYHANTSIITDPGLIYPGEVLTLPASQ